MKESKRANGLFEGVATATLSDPNIFFSRLGCGEIVDGSSKIVSRGSVSATRRLTSMGGKLTVGGSEFRIRAGEPYFELHFIPEGSFTDYFTKRIKQAENRAEMMEYLYRGSRDLLSLIEDYTLSSSFIVGSTNDRLAGVLLKRLGFSLVGGQDAEQEKVNRLVILRRDLFRQEPKLREIRNRFAPIVEPRIAQRERSKAAARADLVYRASQRLLPF